METSLNNSSEILTVVSFYNGTVQYTHDIVDAQFLLGLHGVERVEVCSGSLDFDAMGIQMATIDQCFDRWDHEQTCFGRSWHHAISSDPNPGEPGMGQIGIPKLFEIDRIDHIFDETNEAGFRMVATGNELIDLFAETVDQTEGQKIIESAIAKAEADRQAFLAQTPIPTEYRNPTAEEMQAEILGKPKKATVSVESDVPNESNNNEASLEAVILEKLDLSLSGNEDALVLLENLLVQTIRKMFPKLSMDDSEEIADLLQARRGQALRSLDPSNGLTFEHIVRPFAMKRLGKNNQSSKTDNASDAPKKRGRKPMLMTDQVAVKIVELYQSKQMSIAALQTHPDCQYIDPKTGEKKNYPAPTIAKVLSDAGISLARGRKSTKPNTANKSSKPANVCNSPVPNVANIAAASVSCN